jgi:hypothetical protein
MMAEGQDDDRGATRLAPGFTLRRDAGPTGPTAGLPREGVCVRGRGDAARAAVREAADALWRRHGLAEQVACAAEDPAMLAPQPHQPQRPAHPADLPVGEGAWALRFTLAEPWAGAWTPGYDTLALQERLGLDTARVSDLEREILVAMLASPVRFDFPDVDEVEACMAMRRNIVRAARRTALAFHTSQAERPDDCWTYDEDRGFLIRPGSPLIDALVKATQPEVSGTLFSFSCYRATEYVALLGIAQEAERRNPALLAGLQRQFETRAIRSGEFHDVFLYEYGTPEQPVPPRFFIPGDRTWFRNPDEASSDASGYEGSWVFYLGAGLFANFWKRDRPYTYLHKCIEVWHWRDGLYTDAEGDPRIDEGKVEVAVERSFADPATVARLAERTMRLRDLKGVYAEGGCIDSTREYPRWIGPAHPDVRLPEDPMERGGG